MTKSARETSRSLAFRCLPRIVRGSRHGFSFVEILFAVMILGIGFILIAGIFPVAINQTQANGDETIAATTARQGMAVIANAPNTAMLMVPDGNLHRFGPSMNPPVPTFGDPDLALWTEINGGQVLSEDHRYAWIPFYCRMKDANGLPANTAQVTVIAARVRSHDAYTLADESASLGPLVGNQIDKVTVNANTSLLTQDTITFPAATAAVAAAAPGAFVIIAVDTGATQAAIAAAKAAAGANPPTTPAPTPTAVGWVLKLGAPTGAAGTFYLQPGGDMKNETIYKPATSDMLSVFIVGQGIDPDNTAAYSGGAQDVMAYTTFIPLH